MGISGLLPALKNIIEPQHVRKYAGQKVAVDTVPHVSSVHRIGYVFRVSRTCISALHCPALPCMRMGKCHLWALHALGSLIACSALSGLQSRAILFLSLLIVCYFIYYNTA